MKASSKKTLIRKYMEALREATQSKDLSFEELRLKHNTVHLRPLLRGLGWVSKDRYSSKWIGPHPKSEEELLRMTNVFLAELRADGKRKRKRKRKTSESPVKTVTPPVPPAPTTYQAPVTPQKKVPAKRKQSEISILWGLFTWKQ